MYFTKVELHNFGIYKGTHEMSLTDKIGERNITLVGGLNGRGTDLSRSVCVHCGIFAFSLQEVGQKRTIPAALLTRCLCPIALHDLRYYTKPYHVFRTRYKNA